MKSRFRFLKRLALLFGIVSVLIVSYLIILVIANRMAVPTTHVSLPISGPDLPSNAGNSISVMSWNLGYGGLGKESDFIADNGSSLMAPSESIVDKNVRGIVETVKRHPHDIYLFQELAVRSPLNYGVNLREALDGVLPNHQRVFATDFSTLLFPGPLSIRMGLSTYSKFKMSSAQALALPLESGYFAGILRKQYRFTVAELPASDGRKWVIINVHLAAFDEEGQTRLEQLEEVERFMLKEFTSGSRIIVGGDWNMRLVPTNFPHQTDPENLFWIQDLPPGFPPEDWKIAADASVPSVRTLHQPYVHYDNYTCVIDGFIVSPNVKIDSVRNISVNFEYSDHQPVLLRCSGQ